MVTELLEEEPIEYRINKGSVLVGANFGDRPVKTLKAAYERLVNIDRLAWNSLADRAKSISRREPLGYLPSIHEGDQDIDGSLEMARTAQLELAWVHGRSDIVDKILGRNQEVKTRWLRW